MNSILSRFLVVTSFLIVSLISCQSSENLTADADEATTPSSPLAVMLDTSEVFSSNLTGFALYDPEEDSMIYTQNSDQYFTPASNTKLFTFYAGLKLLPDSVKALEYEIRGDSLIFWGTGNPSLLHPNLSNNKVFEFLKNRKESLYFSDSNFDDELLGPGWSWSDYQYYYQTEKSPLPVYGNVVRFTVEEIEQRKIAEADEGLAVYPPYFQTFLEKGEEGSDFLHRGMTDNRFSYNPEYDTTSYTIEKPFHYTPELITELLSDTLGKEVAYIDTERPESPQTFYSIGADTAFKRMLQPSDNFIAEQLLFVIASELGIPLNSSSVIENIKEEHLNFLSKEPQWVDGSGLSRYNMFTPRMMIELLKAIDNEFADDQALFHLLPAGGERGTTRNWYGAPEGKDPYVFAKTGTLSNNHALSGYLITRNGKKLYFSFMNNHYVTSSSVVKQEMEKVLRHIYQAY